MENTNGIIKKKKLNLLYQGNKQKLLIQNAWQLSERNQEHVRSPLHPWMIGAAPRGKREKDKTIFPQVRRNHFLWRGSSTCALLHFSPKAWNRKPVESKCKILVSQHALKKQISIDSKNGRENGPSLLYKLKGLTRSIHEQLLARRLVEGTCWVGNASTPQIVRKASKAKLREFHRHHHALLASNSLHHFPS